MLLSFPSPWRPVPAGSAGITLFCKSRGSRTSRAPRKPPGGCWRQAQGVGCCAHTRILPGITPGDSHSCPPVSDSTARKEREVMLRLKEVVDRQRDELRAQAHEIVCKSRDTEAVREQLHRFMAMNEELRHKVAVVQAQLKSALEQKSDLEAEVLEHPDVATQGNPTPQHQDGDRSPAHCCFSKEELQQILQERNELKTNLFLVQEELAYYQRELLNEERIPSFFLDAMKSNIKKQRKKIRAKMLGTAEESASWDSTSSLGRFSLTALICSLCSFGLWYQGSSKDAATSSCSGTWEIIDSLDTQPEPEGESKAGSSSPDRAMAPL
uniref:Rab interacting lysosomal protein n=1 Tax=Cyanistes caeruleus TaxID=156563 RepID=A0A8C0U0Z4_CYACU